ncbi:14470_t:CDS:2, partial [Gigaspora rosea]
MAFNQLLSEFIANRKPEQRRKAIITQEDYDLIIKILKNPEDSSIGTANDRFWAKNNFRLYRVICPFQNLYHVLGKIHGSTHQHFGFKKMYDSISNQYAYVPKSFVELYVSRSTQCCTRRNFPAPVIGKTIISKDFLHRVQVDLVSFERYPDKEYRYIAHLHDHFTRFSWTCPLRNERRDWSIGLPIVTYAMNIRCSRPTSHTPYELVFGQHPLRRFNMIEELKQHNITMEEDLSQNMVGSEEDLEETDNDDGLYNDNSDFNHMDNDEQSADDYMILMQQPIRNNQLIQQQNINKNADNHTILIQQTIRNDQQVQQHTQDDNSIADNWEQHIEDKENQEPTNSDFVPYKKRRFSAFQEASNSSTHHDIYRQVANRNLENYRSKMERQMHTKYNIQVRNYEVGDLVKIQIAKIDCGPGDRCALPCKVFLVLPNNMYRL